MWARFACSPHFRLYSGGGVPSGPKSDCAWSKAAHPYLRIQAISFSGKTNWKACGVCWATCTPNEVFCTVLRDAPVQAAGQTARRYIARPGARHSVRFQSRDACRERALNMSDAMGAKLPIRERREPAGWHPGDELTPLEEEMVAFAAAGELVDCGGGPFNLDQMQAWGQERTVRAAVLRHLLIGKDWPADARGVRLHGIRISGPLDLTAAVLHCPLHLDSSLLDAELVCLDQATATGVTITRCHLPGLTGELLTAKTLDLSGSTLTGPLRLPGASMTGALSCRGTDLTGCDSDGNALVADGIRVGGEGVLLDSGFTAAGAIRLPRADITGALSCGSARLTGRGKDCKALVADGIRVGFDVFLDDGFAAAARFRCF